MVIECTKAYWIKICIQLLIGTVLVCIAFALTFSGRSSSSLLSSLLSSSLSLSLSLSSSSSLSSLSSTSPSSPISISAHLLSNLSSIQKQMMSANQKVFLLEGTAYDFYSIDEVLNGSGVGLQWRTFPLPNERLPANVTPWWPRHYNQAQSKPVHIPISKVTTGLAFVERIYITSVPHLKDRQANLQRVFDQYQLKNYEWYLKWTRDTCNAANNKEEVYRKLNLRDGPIGDDLRQRQCSLAMKHVDIWYDIVARNSSLSLILEDDAVFVPYFREKFDRSIYTAIRTGLLKIGGLTQCVNTNNKTHLPPNSDEWINQDPMIVIGICFEMHGAGFDRNRKDAQPMFATHKASSSRCSHAYLLTACSAQALINQMNVKKNQFWPSDFILNEQVAAAPTLQAFWFDPPLVYQGNMVHDLDGISSFSRTTY